MTRGSPEYERLVRNVIDEGLIATWDRNQQSRSSPRSDYRSKPKKQRISTSERPTQSAIPSAIKTQIPTASGSQVCLRFQTLRTATSRVANTLTSSWRPPEVLEHVNNKHGGLKAGHPNTSN
ncbi:hypothetical protein V7S43_004802 [Phytophthora oleae]|uniref:Uncharacterized protein n=1 Tax=Phytophthora oleae TaxID=2107226 RepID=A0ABD3FUS9_9STRA